MLTVRTEVRASRLHGLGAFLLEPVKSGSVVWERGPLDVDMDAELVRALPDVARDFIFTYGTFSRLLGTWLLCGDDARFINHAGVGVATLTSTDVLIDAVNVAARDLSAGDELTIDYSTICDAIRDEAPAYVRARPQL